MVRGSDGLIEERGDRTLGSTFQQFVRGTMNMASKSDGSGLSNPIALTTCQSSLPSTSECYDHGSHPVGPFVEPVLTEVTSVQAVTKCQTEIGQVPTITCRASVVDKFWLSKAVEES